MKNKHALVGFFFALTLLANSAAKAEFKAPGDAVQDEIPDTSSKKPLPHRQHTPTTH